jgi:hypothetical protein
VDYHQVSERALLGYDQMWAWARWMSEVDMVNPTKPGKSRQGITSFCRSLPARGDGDGSNMKTHHFTLILSGVAEITADLSDSLYEATNGDIELNQRDGVVYVEFSRAASTLRAAVTSAIRDVEESVAGVRVVRVESEAANVIAKINADLLGV